MSAAVGEKGALSVRMPAELRRKAAEVARERRMSLNSLINELLERAVREREERELFDGFTLLGSDPGEADVEFALPAQAEAARHG